MSANRTANVHLHRQRHRRRLSSASNHLRKIQNYATVQAARLNTIVGVSGVTAGEVKAAHAAAPYDVRARFVRQATTSAQVTALGIPIV